VQRELAAAPRWIIDGNNAATLPVRLPAADADVLLDLPVQSLRLACGNMRRERPTMS
jgi:hypothetical protein